MRINSISSLPDSYFGKKNKNTDNGALNFGVVTPPDKLPAPSTYSIAQTSSPKKEIVEKGGQKTFTAGNVSAMCAFGAMILSALSILAFKFAIKK